MPPLDPFQDGTAGVLLSVADMAQWSSSLVFAFEVVQPPNLPAGTMLPLEPLNFLSVILLPV